MTTWAYIQLPLFSQSLSVTVARLCCILEYKDMYCERRWVKNTVPSSLLLLFNISFFYILWITWLWIDCISPIHLSNTCRVMPQETFKNENPAWQHWSQLLHLPRRNSVWREQTVCLRSVSVTAIVWVTRAWFRWSTNDLLLTVVTMKWQGACPT